MPVAERLHLKETAPTGFFTPGVGRWWMIIGDARVSMTDQNLGLRHDDLKPAFDASVDPTDAPLRSSNWNDGLTWPNDCVHLPGRRQGTRCAKNRHAGPLTRNDWLAAGHLLGIVSMQHPLESRSRLRRILLFRELGHEIRKLARIDKILCDDDSVNPTHGRETQLEKLATLRSGPRPVRDVSCTTLVCLDQ